MSDWWAGRTLDSLDGVRVNVFEQGRRYGGCLQQRGDHLTLIDTCMAFTVFCQDGQGKVKPVFPLPDIREAPGDPFWQGRFLDELEGVTVTAVLHDGRRLRGVLSRRDDTLTLGRDNTVVFAGDIHGSPYWMAGWATSRGAPHITGCTPSASGSRSTTSDAAATSCPAP